jgi:hypothetical protein
MRPEPAGYDAVTVDLRRAVVAGIVAVRNGAGTIVDASADGQTWTPADVARPDALWPAALFTAGGRAIRYVRVRPANGNGTVDPSEISVWPVTPTPAPGAATPAAGIPAVPGADQNTPGTGTTDDDGGSRTPYLAGSIVLLLMVAGGAAFLLGRRRPPRGTRHTDA